MNAHVFRRVCDALVPLLSGARLEKIHALSPEVSQWAFFGQGERFTLFLRAHRQSPFLYTGSRRLAVGVEPPTFVMRLRKYLAGQRVTGLFSHWIARQLWLRFFPGAEVWLCLDLREGPRLFWQPPEAMDPAVLLGGSGRGGIAPVWPGVAELSQAGPEAWRTWEVLSPALRRTLALLGPEEQAALLADLETGGGDLFVYSDPDGRHELSAWPLPEALRNGRTETVYEDPLEAARLVGEELVVGGLAEEAARRAARPHAAEASRLEKLLAKLEQEEARLAAMAARQDDALALQAVLFRFGADEKRATVELEGPDGPRRLSLDPRLTVRGNMAAMFHQSGRGRRGLAMLEPRRAAVRAELEAARAHKDLAAGMAPGCAAAMGKKQSRETRATAGVPQLPRGVQAFRSSDGLVLLRGRDARGNLAALKLGRPDDLWLHAEGAAGAHVILRRVPGREVPETSLREAAILAALKSPYKDAGTAAVQCAQVRHVHPMRGASPGTVRIDRHEPGLTVRLDPDLETRLAV